MTTHELEIWAVLTTTTNRWGRTVDIWIDHTMCSDIGYWEQLQESGSDEEQANELAAKLNARTEPTAEGTIYYYKAVKFILAPEGE